MKTTTLPPIRVTRSTRKKIEAALAEGETLSSFILEAATARAEVREAQQQFVATGLARSREVRRTGKTIKGEVVFQRLEKILAKARRRASAR